MWKSAMETAKHHKRPDLIIPETMLRHADCLASSAFENATTESARADVAVHPNLKEAHGLIDRALSLLGQHGRLAADVQDNADSKAQAVVELLKETWDNLLQQGRDLLDQVTRKHAPRGWVVGFGRGRGIQMGSGTVL